MRDDERETVGLDDIYQVWRLSLIVSGSQITLRREEVR